VESRHSLSTDNPNIFEGITKLNGFSFALFFSGAATFLPSIVYGLWSISGRKLSSWHQWKDGVVRAHDLKSQQREYWILTFLVLVGWLATASFGLFQRLLSMADLGLLLAVLLLFLGSWYPLVFSRTFAPLLEKDRLHLQALAEKRQNNTVDSTPVPEPIGAAGHLKAGERKAAHWAESVSFIGVIFAILGTIATAAANHASDTEKASTNKCLGAIARVLVAESALKGPNGNDRKKDYDKALAQVARYCNQAEIAQHE
jgi:hypothetical protein